MIPNTDTYNYNLTCFRTKKKKKKKGVFSYGANTQTQEISVGWQAEGLSPSLCRPVPATDAAISIELRGSEKRVSFQTLTLIHYPRLNKQTMVSSRSHPFRPQVRPGGGQPTYNRTDKLLRADSFPTTGFLCKLGVQKFL